MGDGGGVGGPALVVVTCNNTTKTFPLVQPAQVGWQVEGHLPVRELEQRLGIRDAEWRVPTGEFVPLTADNDGLSHLQFRANSELIVQAAEVKRKATPRACVRCRESKVHCEAKRPCDRCARKNLPCLDSVPRKRGRRKGATSAAVPTTPATPTPVEALRLGTSSSEYEKVPSTPAELLWLQQVQDPLLPLFEQEEAALPMFPTDLPIEGPHPLMNDTSCEAATVGECLQCMFDQLSKRLKSIEPLPVAVVEALQRLDNDLHDIVRTFSLFRRDSWYRYLDEKLHLTLLQDDTLYNQTVPLFVFSVGGLVHFMNPPFVELFGWKGEELCKPPDPLRIHHLWQPMDAMYLLGQFVSSIKEHRTSFQTYGQMVSKTGQVYPFLTLFHLKNDVLGIPIFVVARLFPMGPNG